MSWDRITDWLPVYRERFGNWRLMRLTDFARVLWRRATERRSGLPRRPHKGVLIVPISIGPQHVYLPNGHLCCLGTAGKNFDPYWEQE